VGPGQRISKAGAQNMAWNHAGDLRMFRFDAWLCDESLHECMQAFKGFKPSFRSMRFARKGVRMNFGKYRVRG
jgi:hypothetical protein